MTVAQHPGSSPLARAVHPLDRPCRAPPLASSRLPTAGSGVEPDRRANASCILAFNERSRLSPRVVASAARRAGLAPLVWIQGDVDTGGMVTRRLPDAPHLDEGALAEFASARCVLWCFECRAGAQPQDDVERARFLAWTSALGGACLQHPGVSTCFLSSHAASAAGRTIGETARLYRAAEARLGPVERLHIARPGHIRADDKGDGASPFDAPEVSAGLEQMSRSIAITEQAIASALLHLAAHLTVREARTRIHDTPSLWSFAETLG